MESETEVQGCRCVWSSWGRVIGGKGTVQKGAPEISGGTSLSHWLKKISCTCKEETSQSLAINNIWEAMILTVDQRQMSSDKPEWADFLGTQEVP